MHIKILYDLRPKLKFFLRNATIFHRKDKYFYFSDLCVYKVKDFTHWKLQDL